MHPPGLTAFYVTPEHIGRKKIQTEEHQHLDTYTSPLIEVDNLVIAQVRLKSLKHYESKAEARR